MPSGHIYPVCAVAQTAEELIADAYARNPDIGQLATDAKQQVIGLWSEEKGRYIAVCSLAITGEWVTMLFEILINGELPVREWIPVPRCAA